MPNGEDRAQVDETQWRYINSRYDYARSIGVDILRNFLPVAIVLVGLPAIFYEKMDRLFAGANLTLLFLSWSGIILSISLGFIVFYFVFEGYYQFAHSETQRMIRNEEQRRNFEGVSNRSFDVARYIGIGCLTIFTISLILLIAFIASSIFKCSASG